MSSGEGEPIADISVEVTITIGKGKLQSEEIASRVYAMLIWAKGGVQIHQWNSSFLLERPVFAV